MDKIIKVDSDNELNAYEQAQEEFYGNELESEYLNSREVTFEENKFITLYAETISNRLYNLYKDELGYNDVKEEIETLLGKSEFSDFVQEETLNILNDKYNLNLKNFIEKEVSI